MHVIDVIVIVMEVMDIVYNRSCNASDRRDGDGKEHFCRIEVLMHVIDVKAIVMEVMDLVIRSKL